MIFGPQFTHLGAIGLGAKVADAVSYVDITRVPDLSTMLLQIRRRLGLQSTRHERRVAGPYNLLRIIANIALVKNNNELATLLNLICHGPTLNQINFY